MSAALLIRSTCAVTLAVVLATAAPGLQTPAGGEFQVNTFTAGDQAYPATCGDLVGGAVVVWESSGQDGSGNAVRAGRYDFTGAPAGGEIEVNTTTAGDQQLPSVACGDTGDFVVVWESPDADDIGVVGRRFSAAAAALTGEIPINQTTVDRQSAPAVCSDEAGNFVVAWESYDQDGDGYGVVARRFDASGAPRGNEFQVNTETEYSQGHPAIACAADGGFVVVWDSGAQDGDGYGIYAQRVDQDGAKVGSEFRVNTTTEGGQQFPAVAAIGAGDFVVVWESYDDQDGDGYGIFGQRFTATGEPRGEEFQVNAITTFDQQKPAVAAGPLGNFTVAWSSPHEGTEEDVFARHFGADDLPTGTAEVRVNTYTAGSQGALSTDGHVLGVARSGDEFLVVWQSTDLDLPGQDGDGSGVFAQRLGSASAGCIGDCNGDGMVSIDELIRGIRISLAIELPDECLAMDGNSDGTVAINELIQAVNNALNGCLA